MAKPRVIIADTDINYIIPLQLKFAKDFFDLVDIEIITNKQYFDELFMKPQKAEILIISEELYDVMLQRHNIANIFLMMEQYEEEQTGDLNVVKLFKYTSIKEIFNEIISKSAEALKIDQQKKQETQIIVVTSASGGVGKTTVSMGISACLTKNYKKVLYINASRLQAFQYMLDNQSGITTPDVYAHLTNPGNKVYLDIKHAVRNEIFSYLPPFKASLMSVGVNFSIFEKIAVSAKESGEFDFIIVDMDNSFDENYTKLLDTADKVIIVVNQTIKSVAHTNQLVANVNGINGDKYVFVCNDFDKEKGNALINPDMVLKFRVGDYIEHIKDYETKRIADFINEPGIQKGTFLVL
jgi:ATPases involved in chromosome partitioning